MIEEILEVDEYYIIEAIELIQEENKDKIESRIKTLENLKKLSNNQKIAIAILKKHIKLIKGLCINTGHSLYDCEIFKLFSTELAQKYNVHFKKITREFIVEICKRNDIDKELLTYLFEQVWNKDAIKDFDKKYLIKEILYSQYHDKEKNCDIPVIDMFSMNPLNALIDFLEQKYAMPKREDRKIRYSPKIIEEIHEPLMDDNDEAKKNRNKQSLIKLYNAISKRSLEILSDTERNTLGALLEFFELNPHLVDKKINDYLKKYKKIFIQKGAALDLISQIDSICNDYYRAVDIEYTAYINTLIEQFKKDLLNIAQGDRIELPPIKTRFNIENEIFNPDNSKKQSKGKKDRRNKKAKLTEERKKEANGNKKILRINSGFVPLSERLY